jgi:hypothetical protein
MDSANLLAHNIRRHFSIDNVLQMTSDEKVLGHSKRPGGTLNKKFTETVLNLTNQVIFGVSPESDKLYGFQLKKNGTGFIFSYTDEKGIYKQTVKFNSSYVPVGTPEVDYNVILDTNPIKNGNDFTTRSIDDARFELLKNKIKNGDNEEKVKALLEGLKTAAELSAIDVTAIPPIHEDQIDEYKELQKKVGNSFNHSQNFRNVSDENKPHYESVKSQLATHKPGKITEAMKESVTSLFDLKEITSDEKIVAIAKQSSEKEKYIYRVRLKGTKKYISSGYKSKSTWQRAYAAIDAVNAEAKQQKRPVSDYEVCLLPVLNPITQSADKFIEEYAQKEIDAKSKKLERQKNQIAKQRKETLKKELETLQAQAKKVQDELDKLK